MPSKIEGKKHFIPLQVVVAVEGAREGGRIVKVVVWMLLVLFFLEHQAK